MKKIVLFQIVFIMATVIFCLQCYAQTISSSELIKNAKQHDGENVVYQGEVVGDIMIRGKFAWLNINDGSNAIGVWTKKELINGIQHIGSYQAKGDVLEISGIFNRSCPEHGGDLDIHAESLRMLIAGNNIVHTVNKKEIKISVWLFCIILLVWLLRLLIKK